MNESLITALLQDLKHSEEVVRQRATQELWRVWFEQKGVLGLEMIRRAQVELEERNFDAAEAILSQLIQNQPDFAEAWNRRAVLYYLQGEYQKAIADCTRAVQLNPHHFGALHGLGLCQAAIGEYGAAVKAFRQALAIQPYSVENQRWILECTAKLS